MLGLLLVVAVLAAYANGLSGPFFYDDLPAIVSNRSLAVDAGIGQALRPPAGSTVAGRPLLNLSFAINRRVGGLEVRGYHLANVGIHILATLLLFGLIRRTLALVPSGSSARENAVPLAALAAFGWGLHPVQTESVTFVVQRAESLMGLCFLLTFYAFVRGLDSPRRVAWWAVSVLACWCGMAVKEVMVTAPVLVAIFDRVFVAGSWRSVWATRRTYFLALFSSWLLLGFLVAAEGGNRGASMGMGSGISPGVYWLTQVPALWRYLLLSLWPSGLSFDYGYGQVGIGDLSGWLMKAGAVAGILVLWGYALRRHPRIGFLGTWFFLILVPTSVVPGGQTISEHRLYLSLAAATVGVGMMFFTLGRRLGLGLGLAWLATLGILTAQRNTIYRSEIAVWRDSVAKTPTSAYAHNNLGAALAAQGEVDAALPEFGHALRLVPGFVDAHYNLGRALAACGRLDEAISHYEEAVRRRPEFGAAHGNLGTALFAQGRRPEALLHFQTAARLQPDSPEALGNLGTAELAAGDAAAAVKTLERALALQPDFAEAHYNLGNALWVLGRKAEGLREFQRALALRPDFSPAREALMQAGAR